MCDGVASHGISEDKLKTGGRNTTVVFLMRSLPVSICLKRLGDGGDVDIWYCD
jgi:hypothetical protein